MRTEERLRRQAVKRRRHCSFDEKSLSHHLTTSLRKKESADWIYKRLSKRDESAIEEAMYKAMDDAKNDYFDEPDYD